MRSSNLHSLQDNAVLSTRNLLIFTKITFTEAKSSKKITFNFKISKSASYKTTSVHYNINTHLKQSKILAALLLKC